MYDYTDIWELRQLTMPELGAIISCERKVRGWTQETLAELAGITSRTLQRVENGHGGSLDTKRALARAFEYSEIDQFSKPWPMPNAEKIKKQQDKLDRETVELEVQSVTSGRLLRELADTSDACVFHQGVDLPDSATEIFAALRDYFYEYSDVDEFYSATQKLDVDRDFQEMIEKLGTNGFGLLAGNRRMIIRDDQPSDAKPIPLTATYVIVTPKEEVVSSVRVPRRHDFRF